MGAGSRKIVIEFLGKDKSLGRTADSVGNKTDRLGKRMSTIGKVAALGLAGGAVLAGKALVGMAKNAAEDEAAQRRLAIAIKNTTGGNEKAVAGVESWISAQGRALGVTDDELRPALQRFLSVTHDVGKAQKLTSLAMDVSAGSGKDLSTVSAALARAQNGNLTGMARLGVATKDASGKTLSLNQVMKNAAATFKGQAAGSANSLEGKMGRLRLIMDETKETIGAKLLPVATKLADWFLNKGIPAISDFSNKMRTTLGPVIQWVRGLFSSNTNGMSADVTKNLGAIKQTFSSIVSIIQSLWARFGGTLMSYTRSTFNNVRVIIGGAFQVIAGVFKIFSALLKGDWKGVWEGIKQVVRGAWAMIRGIVSQGWNVIKTAFRLGGSAIKGIFNGIWNGVKALARAGINGLVSLIRGAPGKIRALGGAFKSAGVSLIRSFVNGLSNAGQFVSNIAGNITKAVKGAINAGIDKINSALHIHIDWPGPGSFNWQASIGHLAKGTDNWRGGPTWVGERGPEILNLPAGSQVIPNHRIGSGGGATINIVVQGALDPDAVATQIRQMLLKLKRLNGRDLGLA